PIEATATRSARSGLRMSRVQALRDERALYQSSAPCHLRPCQGTPSSLTRSQGTSKGGGVPGEIPQPIRHRRHHFESGFAPLVFVAVALVACRKPICSI